MSFPLGSLQGDPLPGPLPLSGLARLRRQLLLAVGAVAWLLVLLALASHHAADPGYTTSGSGEPVRNLVGLWGAWLSDVMLFLFGHSAWWWLALTLSAWLTLLAANWRGGSAARTPVSGSRALAVLVRCAR
jgi:S-DNA-T family DNA segregation ATPase FtsK/SpoIIIE